MIWKRSTYVEIAWMQSDRIKYVPLESSIDVVIFSQNNANMIVATQPEVDENCFPMKCQAALGIINEKIAQNSTLTLLCTIFHIKFKEKCLLDHSLSQKHTLSKQIDLILSFRLKISWESH